MDSEKVLNLILKELFNAPTDEDILKIVSHQDKLGRLAGYTFYFKGEPLPEARVQALISEAKAISNMELFQMLLSEVEYDGTRRMAVEAADWERVRFAKAFLYAADLIRRKINVIKDLEIKKVANKETKHE